MGFNNKKEVFKVYIAGSLFTEADQAQRLEEERYLKELLDRAGVSDRVDIFNPISNPFNDKSTNPSAEEIFEGDTIQIREADFILLNLDNQLDAGVFVELGQIVGLYPDYNRRKYQKVILPVISDIRMGTAGEYDKERVPWGINTYPIGALYKYDPHINIHTSYKTAIEEMVTRILLRIGHINITSPGIKLDTIIYSTGHSSKGAFSNYNFKTIDIDTVIEEFKKARERNEEMWKRFNKRKEKNILKVNDDTPVARKSDSAPKSSSAPASDLEDKDSAMDKVKEIKSVPGGRSYKRYEILSDELLTTSEVVRIMEKENIEAPFGYRINITGNDKGSIAYLTCYVD